MPIVRVDPNVLDLVAGVPTFDLQGSPAVEARSQPSVSAYHSTLFEDFSLRATAYYNFYTQDEQVAPVADQSGSINSLPRYIELIWRPAPQVQVAVQVLKGTRVSDQRTLTTPAVATIDVARTSIANGYVSPGAISALLVAPRQLAPQLTPDEDLFLASPEAGGKSASSVLHNSELVKPYLVPSSINTDVRTRVNFIDPSIAGALDPNRVAVSTDQAHLATLGSLSKLAGGLEVLSEFNQDVPTRNPPPSFPAPADSPTLMYVGYVIERHTLGSDGSMTLSRVIEINDVNRSRFIDRDVVFGGRYTYRMRSIVQWTRNPAIGFSGYSTLDRQTAFDTSLIAPTKNASFYAGDWSDWSMTEVRDERLPDPPDELRVRPVSDSREMHVCWKMPNDPQRDIASLRLLKSKVVDGRFSDWVQLGEFVPGNGLFIDHDVTPFEEGHMSYMYAMYSVSYHGEYSPLSEKIEARLTTRRKYLGEQPVTQIGPRGDDPTAFPQGPHEPIDTELVALRKTSFYVRGSRSSLPLTPRSYTVEVQSVATGQRVEIPLSVDSTNVEVAVGGAARRA